MSTKPPMTEVARKSAKARSAAIFAERLLSADVCTPSLVYDRNDPRKVKVNTPGSMRVSYVDERRKDTLVSLLRSFVELPEEEYELTFLDNPENGLYFEEIPEEIFTLELPKLPVQSDETDVWNWMQFLRSKTKEEFEMVAVRNPEIRKAVNTLYELSANSKVRAEYEQRMKAWRDRSSEIEGATIRGKIEIARNALIKGISVEIVQEITGLDLKTIQSIAYEI